MFQNILMVIGAITSLWLVIKTIKGFFLFIGAIFEAGFRDKFPYDFMMHFGWIITEMKSRNYSKTGIIDAGGENPGVIMKNTETGNEMEIRLRAPLLSDKGYDIIVSNCDNKTAIVMQNSVSEENKKLLDKYLELAR